ncbi:MAG TPA: D-2-hydroxyacid dehydrogenase [Polyangia bacterium]|nr:D-2-hydroxyacid dehydrogenase [Polyangia bacterium]
MKTVILDSFAADQGDPTYTWEGLRALGELAVYPRTHEDQVLERCRGAGAILTNKVDLRGDLFEMLPEIKYVGILATGTNIVDLEAARAHKIAVTNVPGYATDAVAQLTIALILRLTHDVSAHDAAVKAGRWAASPDFSFFEQPLVELAGKTMAVVGAGAIGGTVARIGEAFGMHVLRAAVPGAPQRPGVSRVRLTDALAEADVVTLHCPLTPLTRGLVDATFLRAMKPKAILVNTGRGPLINEDDLRAALAAGRLGGVALDVLSTEPPPADHPLLDARAPWAKRVIVTPHIGWGTLEARRRLEQSVTRNLQAFLSGERLNRVD